MPEWEIGFQDATVAVSPRVGENGVRLSDGSGPVFVPEFFLSPLPGHITAHILSEGAAPWHQDFDYRHMMGFYGIVRGETAAARDWELEGQILVDDFNSNAIFAPDDDHQNPFIGGWMVSGVLDTAVGRFRLLRAGALRYLFQASGNRPYSYTYYPEVVFPRDGGLQAIDYRDNYVGFCLGENTAAFRLDWQYEPLPTVHRHGIERFLVNARAEYTISGSKSPMNPWTDYDNWQEHGADGPFDSTRFLDEDRLEHRFLFDLGAQADIPPGVGTLIPEIGFEAGVCGNVLRLQDADREEGFPDAQNVEFYTPSDGTFTRVGLILGTRFRY